MATCCDNSAADRASSPTRALTVALAGNPNSGKTTLFNALTGLRQKVANYPGVTVEKKTGRFQLPSGDWVDCIDLPGTYSLISRSPDEHVAMEVLRGLERSTAAPDVVIAVVDASNLQRNLYLVSQLIELGRPLVIALNMMDIAQRRGIRVSAEALSKQLGVAVVPVVAHRKQGVQELKAAVSNARVAPLPDFPLPQAMREELMLVGGGLAILDSQENSTSNVQRRTLNVEGEEEVGEAAPRAWICADDSSRHLDRYQALAERLLIGDRAADIRPIAEREPVASLLSGAASRLSQLGIDPMQADIEAHYRWIENVTHTVIGQGDAAPASSATLEYAARPRTFTEKLDAILIHRVWGMLVFAAIMASLFLAIFWLADPLMGGIESAVGWLADLVSSRLDEGPIKALVTDGIFAGVGAVVVFVPQIAILFFFLAILEDSGYLARAAFLMDKVLAKVGLHGKSFIPLLSSFACAIPGIMATRTIEDRRDRLATIFVAPFMSCSARLPVYALLISTFFATWGAMRQAGLMFALYALGMIAAAGTAFLFRRTLLKGRSAAFILELPTYKFPQPLQVLRVVWTNTKAFIIKAGTTIFCLSVILWAMTYYPRMSQQQEADTATRVRQQVEGGSIDLAPFIEMATPPVVEISNSVAWERDLKARATELAIEKTVASEKLRYSIAGGLGRVMEPLIHPLGYDWKMGIGLVGSFAAREVFVSTMAITYAAGDEDNTEDLSSAMLADTYPDGRPVWTPLVAISLLIWFVLAMQCMSTLAIVRRETRSWRWPIFMLVYMNGLAYVLCLIVYQVGSRLS